MKDKEEPPKRPPHPKKSKRGSTASKLGGAGGGGGGGGSKFNLTPVQRVQVQVIDEKRCAVRACLIIAYVTLIHLIAYLVILGFAYPIIRGSQWLSYSFYGFFLDLALYFFGTGAALKAITYRWLPIKFCLGMASVVLGIFLNVFLFFIGAAERRVHAFDVFSPKHNSTRDCVVLMEKDPNQDPEDRDQICLQYMTTLETALLFMPMILPPVALICLIIAIASAYKAVYLTPLKLPKGQVDAVWLEPYETYDFYVGRVIPRVPGYDMDKDVNTPLYQLFGDDEDSIHSQSIIAGNNVDETISEDTKMKTN